jgi:hypothetical protein
MRRRAQDGEPGRGSGAPRIEPPTGDGAACEQQRDDGSPRAHLGSDGLVAVLLRGVRPVRAVVAVAFGLRLTVGVQETVRRDGVGVMPRVGVVPGVGERVARKGRRSVRIVPVRIRSVVSLGVVPLQVVAEREMHGHPHRLQHEAERQQEAQEERATRSRQPRRCQACKDPPIHRMAAGRATTRWAASYR